MTADATEDATVVATLLRHCRLYEAALNKLPDAIRIVDVHSGHIVFANQAWLADTHDHDDPHVDDIDSGNKHDVDDGRHQQRPPAPAPPLHHHHHRHHQPSNRQRDIPLLEEGGLLQLREQRVDAALFKLLDATPQMLWMTDPAGIITYVNKRWVDYTGLTLEETSHGADGWLRSVHEEDKAVAWQHWQLCMAACTPIEFEYRCRSRHGDYRWFLKRGVPIRSEDGTVTQWIGTSTDIQHAKAAEADLLKAEQQLRADRRLLDTVLAQLPVGLMAGHAPTGDIFLSNDRIRTLWRINSIHPTHSIEEFAQWTASPNYRAFHADGRKYEPSDWPLARSIMTGEVVTNEDTIIQRGDGTMGILRISSAPVHSSPNDESGGKQLQLKQQIIQAEKQKKDDRIIAGVVVCEDVTDHQRLLEEKTTWMAREQAALEALRLKSEFLANMSHEIRTPLNGVIGMADLLRETALTEAQVGYVDTIKQSGRLLLVVINDILDFSKVEAGKLELELRSFRLADLFENVYSLMRPLAVKQGIEIHLKIGADLPESCVGDAARLKQIVFNLVGNAIKFTTHGSVCISVSMNLRDDGTSDDNFELEFSVVDTGIGMSKETVSRLFQPFTQADSSTTRRYGGTGLGLSICKGLVALMHGRIKVITPTDTDGGLADGGNGGTGGGTAFHVFVRLGRDHVSTLNPTSSRTQLQLHHRYNAESSCSTASNASVETEDYSATRVLVAEDNAVNQVIVRRVLEKFNVRRVIMTDDGQTACNTFTERLPSTMSAESGATTTTAPATPPMGTKFDFVLMDCQMPVMDGYEATRRIRAHEKAMSLPRTPIIALTASAMKDDIEACFAAGMDDHIAKPFSHDALKAIVTRYGRRRRRSVPSVDAAVVLADAQTRHNTI